MRDETALCMLSAVVCIQNSVRATNKVLESTGLKWPRFGGYGRHPECKARGEYKLKSSNKTQPGAHKWRENGFPRAYEMLYTVGGEHSRAQ